MCHLYPLWGLEIIYPLWGLEIRNINHPAFQPGSLGWSRKREQGLSDNDFFFEFT